MAKHAAVLRKMMVLACEMLTTKCNGVRKAVKPKTCVSSLGSRSTDICGCGTIESA